MGWPHVSGLRWGGGTFGGGGLYKAGCPGRHYAIKWLVRLRDAWLKRTFSRELVGSRTGVPGAGKGARVEGT